MSFVAPPRTRNNTKTPTPTDNVSAARDLVQSAKALMVLTGAGISAESGVPTFRGPGGYWRNRNFTELANPNTFAREPETVWHWYYERRQTVARCQPNAAHASLVALAARQSVTLVTQNVDGLHERAGHPDIIRLHGSLWLNRCTSCGAERRDDSTEFLRLPKSPCCDALERPAIVWFGETLPLDAIERAHAAVAVADVVLVIGTSGVVYPAAGFVATARAGGAKVVDVNPEPMEIAADIFLRGTATEVVPQLCDWRGP